MDVKQYLGMYMCLLAKIYVGLASKETQLHKHTHPERVGVVAIASFTNSLLLEKKKMTMMRATPAFVLGNVQRTREGKAGVTGTIEEAPL